jgi:hypothetical protein
MAKKMFLYSARVIPPAEVLSESREEAAPSTSRNSLVSEIPDQLTFKILGENSKFFENLTRPVVHCLLNLILWVKNKSLQHI